MIQVAITKAELLKALADIERCEKQGFPASTPILRLATVGRGLGDSRMVYDERVILMVNDNDPHTNYGNTSSAHIGWHKYENGQCVSDRA